MESQPEALDPQQALALVSSSRAEIADRLVTPWWYHPVLGLLVGGLIAAQALPVFATLVVLPVYGLGVGLLVAAYRRTTGLWISGFHPAAPKRPVWLLMGAVGGLFLAAAVLQRGFGLTAAPVVAGVLVVPVVVVVGRRFDEALRAALRAP